MIQRLKLITLPLIIPFFFLKVFLQILFKHLKEFTIELFIEVVEIFKSYNPIRLFYIYKIAFFSDNVKSDIFRLFHPNYEQEFCRFHEKVIGKEIDREQLMKEIYKL